MTAPWPAGRRVDAVEAHALFIARRARPLAVALCAVHALAAGYGVTLGGPYLFASLFSALMLAAGVVILFGLARTGDGSGAAVVSWMRVRGGFAGAGTRDAFRNS